MTPRLQPQQSGGPCHTGKKRQKGSERFGPSRAHRATISRAKLWRCEDSVGAPIKAWSLEATDRCAPPLVAVERPEPVLGKPPFRKVTRERSVSGEPLARDLCDFASACGGLADGLSAMGTE
jgi:hypothetical protein